MLLDLPNEILSRIVWSLDSGRDAASAMLVSRRISQLAQPVFIALHPQTIITDFDSPGLDEIERLLLTHDSYRQATTALTLSTPRFFGEHLAWHRDSVDGTLQINDSAARVRKIFSSLPRCEHFSIRLGAQARAAWYEEEDKFLHMRDIMAFFFRAVEMRQLPALTHVTFDLYPRDPEHCLRMVARPPPKSAFWTAWAAQVQFLRMYMDWDDSYQDGALASDLILRAKSLWKLSLSHCLQGSFDKRSPSIYNLVVAAPEHPAVTHLHISDTSFELPEHLLRLVSCFKSTLQNLFVEYMNVQQGGWKGVCDGLRDIKFPHLATITLLRCKVAGDTLNPSHEPLQFLCPLRRTIPPSLRERFTFAEHRQRTRGSVYLLLVGVRYTGKQDMDLALQLVGDAFYSRAAPPPDVPRLELGSTLPRQGVAKIRDADFEFRLKS